MLFFLLLLCAVFVFGSKIVGGIGGQGGTIIGGGETGGSDGCDGGGGGGGRGGLGAGGLPG
jgi:hypothetical protein